MIRIGDLHESALWFAGDDADQRETARKAIERVFTVGADDRGLVYGPVTFVDLAPGHPRVPDPPAQWRGRNPMLLVGEAEVRGVRSLIRVHARFVDDLAG